MASSEFDTELFEKRLQNLKDSQESIQSLSTWCLERRPHHKKIVATWLQVLKKVKVEHRLTLFYLANDVIQYSKRKNFEFVESWGTTLQRATTMVRDEKVKHRILRIFKIWDQRQVYDEEFLADLSGLISAAPKKKADPQPVLIPEEFQAPLLISTMRSCATLEQATDARLRDLRECKIDIDNADELCATLKDRRHVEDAEKDVDVAVGNIESYVRALEAEIRERTQVIELLEQGDQFYETQRGEVKIVTNAYRNFGSRVKNLKKKLDELIPMLISPIPSPDINAPSPSPDSDIELPGEESMINQSAIIDVAPPTMYGSYGQDYDLTATTEQIQVSNDFTPNFSSFMGGNMDFDMRNLFNEKSGSPMNPSQQYDPMEPTAFKAMSRRLGENENTDNFNISSFLKNVLPPGENTSALGRIPGIGDSMDGPINSLHHQDYGHMPGTPISSRMMAPQTSGNGLNSCQMAHSTLSVRNMSDSHTSSPYSSQNSQSNVNFESSIVNPLPPPPMPPPIFLDEDNCYNKLPPKFPTWAPTNKVPNDCMKWDEKGKNNINPLWTCETEKNKGQWPEVENNQWNSGNNTNWNSGARKDLTETPESPPMYEKSSFRDPIEYNDTHRPDPLLGSAGDVDHRVISVPLPVNNPVPHRLVKAADVDHRNLISLTGSPANHSSAGENLIPAHGNDALWSNTDQDYRQQVQPGDNVESVDMDMSLSDEENENKQKGRVLVDVRSQDRDMRGPNPSEPQARMDMDMRMLSGPPPGSHILAPPPPPPMAQYPPNQSDFHPPQGPPPFGHNNPMEFHPPNPPSGFQQDFIPGRQDFGQGPNFHQDFNYHENNLAHEESRGRYQPHNEQHREPFNRNERGGRGRGRGFGRKRHFSEDQNNQQWNNGNNNRRPRGQQDNQQQRTPEKLNNRPPPLLQTPLMPDNIVLLDENGMPIGLSQQSNEQFDEIPAEERIVPGVSNDEANDESVHKQEINADPRSQVGEAPKQLSEQLEALMNSSVENSELKRLMQDSELDDPLGNKRLLLPNGPLLNMNGPPPEIHPVTVFDYGSPVGSPNFRPPRGPFPAWRGSPVNMRGGRGSFRGGPRPMWTADNRSPRGPPPNPSFSPRGMNRGTGQFRGGGGGFRGRGRGGNW